MEDVFSADLTTLSIFDTDEGTFSPGQFRFIDCNEVVNNNHLRLLQCHPGNENQISFVAISYPWRGNNVLETISSFRVSVPQGCDEGDPISFSVLRAACRAALVLHADYIWLDRICIMQKNKDDKRWQIQMMSKLYQICKASLALPGGLQQLAGVHEKTTWIQRAWTLQEAIHVSTYCLFHWVNSGGQVYGLTDGEIIIVDDGYSAMMELGKLLQAAAVEFFNYSSVRYDCKIFGSNRDSILTLMGAKELRDQELREGAIWRSALMRTSSRPVDMIFSIMGIFGITLDVSLYEEKDRERATLDLTSKLLEKGHKATWLAASIGNFHLPTMSTMPQFPETTVGGEAFYLINGKREPVPTVIGSGITWGLALSPRLSMTALGRGVLTLTAQISNVKVYEQVRRDDYATYQGLSIVAPIEITEGSHSGLKSEINLSATMEQKRELCDHSYKALVLGSLEFWNLPATSARAVRGAVLLMLVSWDGTCWRRRGLGQVVDDFTSCWDIGTIKIS